MFEVVKSDSKAYRVDHFPDVCPQCHHAIEPKYEMTRELGFLQSHVEKRIDVFFSCPRQSCRASFIAFYTVPPGVSSQLAIYDLDSVAPQMSKIPTLPDRVSSLSPSFVEIYSQADVAEQSNLDQICGCGYRKALEFLIKDFACHYHPAQIETIRGATLATVIRNHIDERSIKTRAELASWLGNDETHYVRKWSDKDLNDLKALLELTVAAVNHHLLADHYQSEMKPV
ncbi:DUF4145 domain-containing protein [Marilutibacter spongiae]|uniref:DUF4145 domain-containing protein n=1 Tax=Marilutibacter spongiae TaxID=2025720 RepID=A0A7W3TJ54_9GAMM|nr:DUF4145 domain-containing protein [Lysobacter spongiae]MBB1059276.1 DUF4145 domain-containing protein [Lysobacter spongiae]